AQQKIDQGPRKGDVWGPDQRDPCAEPVAAFCRDLSRQTGAAAHGVGCFPLVSTDLRTEAPWVSELGVNVADQIATGLGTGGASSTILDTDQLALRLSEQNLSRSSLTTLESIAAASTKLGVDRITFGTIRRRDKVGALDRDVLVCDLQAYDVIAGKVVASAHWEIPSDDASLKKTWSLAQSESPWLSESRWPTSR